MKVNIPLKYRPLVVPMGSLAILVILSLVLSRVVIGQGIAMRDENRKLISEIAVLDGRIEVLRTLGAVVPRFSEDALAALPESNPTLLVTRQLKSIAAEEALLIDNLTTNVVAVTRTREKVEEDPVFRVSVGFDLIGDYSGVSEFLRIMDESSPLLSLQSVNIIIDGEVVEANIKLAAYWSPIPTTLPAITESIDSLTQREGELLDILSRNRRVGVGTSVAPNDPEVRANPFEY